MNTENQTQATVNKTIPVPLSLEKIAEKAADKLYPTATRIFNEANAQTILSALTEACQSRDEECDRLMERSVFAMSIMEDDGELWRDAYEKSDKCPMLAAAFELRSRIQRLKEVLEPFAQLSDKFSVEPYAARAFRQSPNVRKLW